MDKIEDIIDKMVYKGKYKCHTYGNKKVEGDMYSKNRCKECHKKTDSYANNGNKRMKLYEANEGEI